MSDLLAATGWIGEHPMTGADVAHRATMLDSGGAAEIAAIARAWGLVDVTCTPSVGGSELEGAAPRGGLEDILGLADGNRYGL